MAASAAPAGPTLPFVLGRLCLWALYHSSKCGTRRVCFPFRASINGPHCSRAGMFSLPSLSTGMLTEEFSQYSKLGVSIVVCNLLVLLTSFYRKFRNNGETTERHDSTVPTDYSRGRLATVSTPQAPSDVHISPNSPSATDIISFTELGSSMMHSLSSSYNPSSYTSNISKG